MSAILFAVPLSVLIGALAIIRRDRTDRHCSTLVAVRRTPENSMRRHASQRRDLARRRNRS